MEKSKNVFLEFRKERLDRFTARQYRFGHLWSEIGVPPAHLPYGSASIFVLSSFEELCYVVHMYAYIYTHIYSVLF